MLEAHKDKHFVAPGIGWLINTLYNASEFGITEKVATDMGYKRELEAACESLTKMHKRGIRVLPGGDYGFAWTPHGTNARDLEYLVKYTRSEEHTSELQSLMRISYAVFCLKKKQTI